MNFFSDHYKKQKSSHNKQIIIIVMAISIALVFLASTLYLYLERKKWDENVNQLEEELLIVPDFSAELAVAQNELSVYEGLFNALARVDSQLKAVSFFKADNVRTIMACMPENVNIDTFILNGVRLSIEGELDSMATLASLVQRLEETGLFISVTPATATVDADESLSTRDNPVEIITYSISCILKGATL